MRVGAIAALAGMLQACSGLPLSDADGGLTYVIVGFGIVSVPAPKGHPDVAVVRARSLGLMMSDHPSTKLALGYASSLVTVVSKDSPGVIVTTDENGLPTVTRP